MSVKTKHTEREQQGGGTWFTHLVSSFSSPGKSGIEPLAQGHVSPGREDSFAGPESSLVSHPREERVLLNWQRGATRHNGIFQLLEVSRNRIISRC